MEYGYCRISTPKQNIERQVRNIQSNYPAAIIVKEVYTGTKFQGRKELDKLLKTVKPNDTIIFDSVSRMSRNADDGFSLYERLYNDSINLVFLKEPHINTGTYKKALENNISMTGTNVDFILEGINKYLMALAKEQIQIAFDQAQKEVDDLHQRTKGTKLVTKKSIRAKEQIKKYNKSFNGSLTNEDTWKLIGISKTTFYKYKDELLAEIQ